MDDEKARLLSALRQRLTELNAQVTSFQRDQADDFRRYAAHLLSASPVSADVAADVARTINREAALPCHAALYPGFLSCEDASADKAVDVLAPPTPTTMRHATPITSTSTSTSTSPVRAASPPSTPARLLSPTTSLPLSPTHLSSSPSRDRRPDFTGLFTPPFLPLLDSSSYVRQLPSSAAPSPAAATMATMATTDNGPPSLLSPASLASPLPEPRRIKSALRRRRSTSSSRSSSTPASPLPVPTATPPRRVRFAFQGTEVLPTSTPPEVFGHDLAWLLPSHHTGQAFEDDPIDMGSFQESEFQESSDASSAELDDAVLTGLTNAPSSSSASLQRSLMPRDDAPLSPLSPLSPTDDRRWDDPALGSGSLDPCYQGGDENNSPQHHRRRHSLILDDGDLDPVPLSRKMSSSDRLRALSKVPLEDPSMWTVVDPQSDPADGPLDASTFVAKPKKADDPAYVDLFSGHVVTQEFIEEEEDDSQSTLSMHSSPKDSDSQQDEAPAEPPAEQAPLVNGTTTPVRHSPSPPMEARPEKPARPAALAKPAEPTDNDFFEFEHDEEEDGQMGYPLSRVSTVRPYLSEDEDEDEDDQDDKEVEAGIDAGDPKALVDIVDEKVDRLTPTGDVVAAAATAAAATAAAGTTGAVVDRGTLLQPPPVLPAGHGLSASLGFRPAAAPPPRLSSSAAFGRESGASLAHSVGSYRGRPISMFNVVKDPRILQEVAQLGEFNSFVGGVDGRTGVDDDDSGAVDAPRDFIGSFPGRDARALFSGTPRSLSERMALEDAMRMGR